MSAVDMFLGGCSAPDPRRRPDNVTDSFKNLDRVGSHKSAQLNEPLCLSGTYSRLSWCEKESQEGIPYLQVRLSALSKSGDRELCQFALLLPALDETALRVRKVLMSAWLAQPLPLSSDDVALRLFALTASRREAWRLEVGMPTSPDEVATTIRCFIPPINEFTRDTSSVHRQLFVERNCGGVIYRLKAQLYPETGEISFRLGIRTPEAFDFGPQPVFVSVDRDIEDISYVELQDSDALKVPDDTESRLISRAYQAMELFIEEGPEPFLEEYVAQLSNDNKADEWSPYNQVDERLREGELDTGTAQFSAALAHGVELYVEHGDNVAVLRILSDSTKRPRQYDWVMNLDPNMPRVLAEERIQEFCNASRTLAHGGPSRLEPVAFDARRQAVETIYRSAVLYHPDYGHSPRWSVLDAMWGVKLGRSLQTVRGVSFYEYVPEGPEQLLMQLNGELRCKVILVNSQAQPERPELLHEMVVSVNPAGMSVTAHNQLSGECSVWTSVRPSDKQVLDIVRAFSKQLDDPQGDFPLQSLLSSIVESRSNDRQMVEDIIAQQSMPSFFISNLPSPHDLEGRKMYESAARIVKRYERINPTSAGNHKVKWHPHEREAEVILGANTTASYLVSLFILGDRVRRVLVTPGMLSLDQHKAAASRQRDFQVALPVTVSPGSQDRLCQTLIRIGDFLQRDAAGERTPPSPRDWLAPRPK